MAEYPPGIWKLAMHLGTQTARRYKVRVKVYGYKTNNWRPWQYNYYVIGVDDE